ncbi:MAG: RCC1 domain-containing protein [Chloroflexota bacterium]
MRADGTVWAWGWNEDGQLGNGTFTSGYAPAQVEGLALSASAVSTDVPPRVRRASSMARSSIV